MFSDSDGTVMSPSVTGKLCFCKNTLVKVLCTSEGPKFFSFFFRLLCSLCISVIYKMMAH